MPKRTAEKELDHFNWNQEDDDEEPEETSKIASPEVMSKRIIKTGKRRVSGTSSSGPGKQAFSNFAGFGGSTTNNIKSTFSFLSNTSNSNFSNTNGISDKNIENNKDQQIGKITCNEYLSKLKGLNETVSEWIKLHVDKNPACILTPIFNDYDKYLKEIQSERLAKKSEENSEVVSISTTAAATTVTTSTSNTLAASPPKSIFNNNLFPSNNEKETTSALSKILQSNESAKSSLIPGLNPLPGPSLSSGIKTSTLFAQSNTLGSNTLSPFGSCSNVAATPRNEEAEKEDEEPPKNVFEPVTEEGAIFSQRVKLFLKKKDNFVDNGVGTLYIKPVDKEGSKYQTIVRADTNLGNILLNIILKESIPSKRVGKNNVLIICILDVEKEFKPVQVLLRVKTEAEADRLLEQINKYKK